MASLSIRLDDEDLEILKKGANELRIPYTILARTLIVQGLKAGPPTGGPKRSS